MNEVAPMIASLGFFLMVGWLVRTTSRNSRLKDIVQKQSDLTAKMVDKFGTAEELVRYLESDGGKGLLSAEVAEKGSPFGRILGSLQSGVVLFLVGMAFFLLQGRIGDGEATEGMLFIGALGVALGLGFIISGALAYHLSRRWGLIETRPPQPERFD